MLDYVKVHQLDTAEAARMYSTCAELGFFYLDLKDNLKYWRDTVQLLLPVAKEYFAKPLDEKLKDKGIFEVNTCG